MTAYELRISDWSSDVCSSDLQYLALEASYQRVFAPFRPLHQGRHRRARLAPFADALERLVILEFEQRNVPGGDRKSVVSGKSGSEGVELGGRRLINKKT